jgi:alkanesulfonate monooxygenase SsuD/methylene tetrahydromethanopterin reductase-like flavin-dependent oxidoreductase (luciferase family)
MRFDMRAPSFGAPAAELYRAALAMAEWADSRGCLAAVVSEHHTAEDGYLPAPIVMAAAVAGRTEELLVSVAVVLLPLHDPVRLAEEMCVVDHLSGGRVSYVAAIGYRPVEYEMYGVDFGERGRLADEKLAVLLRAKTGEPFEHEGRTIHVTPAPLTPGGPVVAWGGGSPAAARRAGRNGIGFFAQKGDPHLGEVYERSCRDAGHTPGMCMLPPRDMATVVFVADDVDAAWEELGPHLVHDVTSYAAWNEGDTDTASLSSARTAEELRAEDRTHRVISVEEAVESVRAGQVLALHPLVGGLPPDVAWRYLRTVTDTVVPAATG